MKLPPDTKSPPHWLAHISTPNVDGTVEQAVDLGARVLSPCDGHRRLGRFAIMTDPHGASFAVYTPEGPAPGHDGEAQLREFSWHELATHDYPAAFRFYERLFGWEKSSAMDIGETGPMECSASRASCSGHVQRLATDAAPPGWLHYVLVDDLSRAIEAVKSGGGKC